ncbi:MAG: ATP-binding cassette domain-containing protein [Atopobiaceae bacterium]
MLQLKHIRKAYKTSDFTQVALDDVSVTFRDSEFVAVLGPSGSGKTTMLNVLGGLDHADSGDIVVNGVSTHDFKSKDWDTYRNHRVGFVFQSYNLIPHQSVLSNVELALTLSGVGRMERRARATKALQQVGLGDHLHKRPNQLSGGQMQRVAIARALVNDPDIVLADEPTGALDTQTGIQVMNILKDVAKDRLVVMVTHNPELAQQYATRIVRVQDGRIVDDSNPLTSEEMARAENPGDDRQQAKSRRKASMSFLTALALSFNNLWSKKGRTLLTAFAGSIGIIGIAAILAVSNGVNNYIAKVEQDTLSNYPLQITQSSTDATSLMSGMMSAQGNTEGNSEDEQSNPSGDDQIPETNAVSTMFSEIKSNDLKSFKRFLDSGGNGITSHVSTIGYKYGITPMIYSSDTSSKVTRLGTLVDSSSSSMSKAGRSLGMGGSGLTSFEEMMDDQDLLSSQYDVVAGQWPTAANEAVLVLGKDGTISDYTLYMLGVLDPSQLESLIESIGSSDTQVDVPDTSVDFTYNDALGMTFKVLSPAYTYQKNTQSNTWTDMSSDSDYMRQVLDDDAIDLKIVGVIRPNDTTETTSLDEGVAYTHALTTQLMQNSSGSQIVQEQLANPSVDVFTGKTFDELRTQGTNSFDMSSIFSIDQDALKKAFSFDTDALQKSLASSGNVDLSGVDMSSLASSMDLSDLQLDTSGMSSVFDVDTIEKLMAGAPQPDLSKLLDAADPAQATAVGDAASKLAQDFFAWYTADGNMQKYVDSDGNPDFNAAWEAYSASDQGKAAIDEFGRVAQMSGNDLQQKLQAAMQDYITSSLAPYLQQQMSQLMLQAAQVMTAQLTQALQSRMAAATQSLGSQLSSAISSQLQSQMGNLTSALQDSFSVDPSAFANAIHFNMTQDDLTSLLMNYAQGSQTSYESNLEKLGYADEADPTEIDLYPKSFDDKTAILGIIDDYNQQAKDEGQDQKVINYTDMVGTLMSSVTDIVHLVSDVLIAFVSISLVVSSIMIAIITYISVLERKKEIGILRAMGASKLNIANVFNAETIIEGLISGVFAILVVLAVEPPVNAYVMSWKHVPDIMALSPMNAVVLICISVGLTLLAGLIPSTIAARRDPVEALRSE